MSLPLPLRRRGMEGVGIRVGTSPNPSEGGENGGCGYKVVRFMRFFVVLLVFLGSVVHNCYAQHNSELSKDTSKW